MIDRDRALQGRGQVREVFGTGRVDLALGGRGRPVRCHGAGEDGSQGVTPQRPIHGQRVSVPEAIADAAVTLTSLEDFAALVAPQLAQRDAMPR